METEHLKLLARGWRLDSDGCYRKPGHETKRKVEPEPSSTPSEIAEKMEGL